MIVTLWRCSKCDGEFQVHPMDSSLHLLQIKMHCPISGCDGTIMTVTEAKGQPRKIKGDVLFRAVNGMGLPEEQDCSVKRVRKALLEKKVVSVDLEDVHGKKRSIIRSIGLEDGTRVFLSTVNDGAVVYRVSEVKNGSRRTR